MKIINDNFEQTCENCKWCLIWKDFDEEKQLKKVMYFCHRFPPFHNMSKYNERYPQVQKSEFCGEFRQK